MLEHRLGQLQLGDHLVDRFVVVCNRLLLEELFNQMGEGDIELIVRGLFVEEHLFLLLGVAFQDQLLDYQLAWGVAFY